MTPLSLRTTSPHREAPPCAPRSSHSVFGFVRRLIHARLLVVFGIAALSGCAEPPASPTLAVDSDPASGIALATDDQPAEVVRLAHALARVLGDVQHRRTVRNALRESDWTEHKVPLNAFPSAPGSERIVVGVEELMELVPGGLTSYVANLPEIDFYMVARAHRANWRPSQAVIVAAHMGETAPMFAFNGLGGRVGLDLANSVLPNEGLLLLQAAEPKSLHPIARVADAETITDPLDRPVVTANQEACNPADPGCDEEGGGGGGISGDYQAPICTNYRWTGVTTQDQWDNGNPYEGNEIEVHWDIVGGSSGHQRVTGLGYTDSVSMNLPLFCTTDPQHLHIYASVEF